MDVVFSGQAGTLAFLEGADVRFVRAGDLEVDFLVGREGASYLFEGTNDVVVGRETNRDHAFKQFEQAWESDRALRLVLIALDVEEENELRLEAADCLEEIFERGNAATFVENQLYSRPLPGEADPLFLMDGSKWPLVNKIISTLVDRQTAIRIHRQAWDALSASLFVDLSKADFEEGAIGAGAFRILASLEEGRDPNLAILECYKALSSLPNVRAVVSDWTKQLKRVGIKHKVLPEESEDESLGQIGPPVESYERYRKVIHQQAAIVEKMRAGSVNLARRYTDELIHSQLQDNGANFAAKSLCSLAQAAKQLGLDSLQLEWAERAVSIDFSDAWSHGQYADALMQYARLDEALTELSLCEAYGDPQFAATGRARILRYQGRLDEALAAFKSAQEEFPDEPFSWMGSAETYRDMCKFDEALQEYEAALKKFPESLYFRCGLAAVLANLGRPEDALSIYRSHELKNDLVAINGRAGVLKDLGRLSEALDAVSRAVEFFPTDSVSRCLRAEIYRESGRFTDALQLYADVKSMAPNNSVAYAGFAEVLRDLRRYPEAVDAYAKAIERFPFDEYLANGYANIRKVSGEFDLSLQLYESAVKRFPYSLIAKSGRADLLKRLGHYDDALEAYDEIIALAPDYSMAKNGKAAILVVRREFESALKLLPSGPRSTRDDWVAWHIRGMIILRRGQIEEAIEHFERSKNETPFVRERRYFERALSVARLHQGEFKKAFDALADSGTGGLSNVLRLHAFSGMGHLAEARSVYADLTVRCPPQLVQLKDAIASKFGLTNIAAYHNDNWILDRETEAILQEAA
jgi:tetratricopeptide (TPR) repeat protein